ncbi:MAG: FAD-dependent oxidoreductase [Solirubrobacterales bacterium]
MAAGPTSSAVLSASQLRTLAELGEERTAAAGEVLFSLGDRTYPFIAILEGEAAVIDGAGEEVVRHGASGFLGEMGLLSGQTVYLSAVALESMRYLAVDRDDLRRLLVEDSSFADLVLATFIRRREILQERHGIGVEILGSRESAETRSTVEWVRRARLPHTWRDPEHDPEAARALTGVPAEDVPLVRLPGGPELRRPTNGELSRALGIGLELAPVEEVDLAIVGGGPAGLGAAVYGASEGLETLVVESTVLGGQAGTSRRIENYLGFPAGISGTELTSRAITQARKFSARTATPYRATALEADGDLHVLRLDSGEQVRARAVVLATGADYRRLPVERLEEFEGISVFYAAGPPEAQLCGAQRVGVIGGGNSAAQAAIWLARGGALVTLLHRRADLSETMSAYLIDDLAEHRVTVRARSEVAELHGSEGELEGVTLADGTELPLAFLFCFLGAAPCTDWLGDAIARDAQGFLLTGAEAGPDRGLLETSVPGVYAAGDVRSGSIKRCATAVGEGATVVRLVHERLAA